MSHTVESLQQSFNLSEEEVKNTLKACGLSLKRKSYKDTEINQQFTLVREYFSSNRVQNYDEAASLYKSEGEKSKSAKDYKAVEELVEAIEQLGTNDAEEILSRLLAKGQKRASQLEQTYDVVLLQKLREEMGEPETEEDLDLLEVVEARRQQIMGTRSTLSLPGSSNGSSSNT
jgi:hypothetical protein